VRVSSVQDNPKGAAGLQQIRRFRTVQTLGRRPEAIHFTEDGRGRKRGRGIAATPVAAAGRDEVLRRGDAPGPRHGWRNDTRARALGFERSGVVVSLSLRLRAKGGETLRQWIASGAATHRGSALKEVSDRRRNPMDGSGPRGRKAKRGENPSRR